MKLQDYIFILFLLKPNELREFAVENLGIEKKDIHGSMGWYYSYDDKDASKLLSFLKKNSKSLLIKIVKAKLNTP